MQDWRPDDGGPTDALVLKWILIWYGTLPGGGLVCL